MSVLDELEQAVAEVAAKSGTAVVGIGQGWGLGSGVVVGDGLVLTNAHNILSNRPTGREPSVTFADGRTVAGTVSGVDVDGDLAVVRADTTGTTPIAWEPASVSPALGDVVLGLANPGGRGLRVALGQVSAVGRSFRGPRGRVVTGSVEHTVPLVKGSSGGPVVDRHGRFVALNTNRLGEGFYAAIPADAHLRARVDALAAGASPRRLRLGVGLLGGKAALHLRRSVGLPDRDGILVREVEDGSPAARAGLRQGDLITGAGDRAVARLDDLHIALDGLHEEAALTLGVVRGVEELTLTVTFDRPDADAGAGPA